AQGKEKTALDLLKGQSVTGARSKFQEAQQDYNQAGREATAEKTRVAALQELRKEAEQARVAATKAGQDAEQSGASRLAPRLFAMAQAKLSDGDSSLGRQDPSSAKLRFEEALQAFKQAGQEAAAEQRRVAALQRQQSAAEQARERMTGARRAAEESEAVQYAPKLFALAQTKERDGQTALTRSDYGQAAKLFGEAQAEYQSAAREADGEKGRLKSGVEQSRSRMVTRRTEAVNAEAARFAKDDFDAAQAKQTEGDTLQKSENFAAASQAYQDAG